MLVELRLFALARDRAGRPTLALDLPEPATVADLKRALVAAVPGLEALLPVLKFAVDSEYADDATPIRAGSELAAIPPVSGGGDKGGPADD